METNTVAERGADVAGDVVADGVPTNVEAELFARPTDFSFFQAVRLLERGRAARSNGDGRDPGDVVRFSVHASTAFPASEIQAIDRAASGPPRMLVNFFGLIGPQGVLPHWYTHFVANRLRARDGAAHAFLDIFHHRIIGHLHRAWEKMRPYVAFERTGEDRLSTIIRGLVGLRAPVTRERLAVRDESVLFYASLFANHHRSGVGLEQLLADYFDVPVRLEQFAGGWYALDGTAQCQLGEEGESTMLGGGAVVGDEVWDPQLKARIHLGPLTREQYDRFLPHGSAHEELRELTRFYSGDEVEFELQLTLRQQDIAPIALGSPDSAPLGWGTWLVTSAAQGDGSDTVITL